MSKLIIIDGNAILHRAYHALPPLTTKNNEPINAVYGMVSMLLRVVEDLRPEEIAVAFDRPEPTFRKIEFKDYQAHRPEMDKDLGSQFEKAKDFLAAISIPIYEKPGFEADDVLATIAREAKASEVVIVTGDRDILQLVNEKTKVYMPIKGLSEAKLFNREDVIEKIGVPPEQIVDFKALVGDPSDNYKGVPGIGPKTAQSLLSSFSSLENIYKNLDKIPEKTRILLKNHKALAFQSQLLAKIIDNVDIKFDEKKASSWKLDSQEVVDLFVSFGFKTLTKRIKKLAVLLPNSNQQQLL